MLTNGATIPLKSQPGGACPSALSDSFLQSPSTLAGVHASICEPPIADWMSPIGTTSASACVSSSSFIMSVRDAPTECQQGLS